MATIKSYTDLSQSKKLAEILPLESADMHYQQIIDVDTKEIRNVLLEKDFVIVVNDDKPIVTPAWSLSALLGVLPKGTNIRTPNPINALGYCCWNQYDEIYADNPVDACVEMIEKLHKENLL